MRFAKGINHRGHEVTQRKPETAFVLLLSLVVNRFYLHSFGQKKSARVYTERCPASMNPLHQMLIQRLLNRFLGTIAYKLLNDLAAFEN